MIQTLLLSEGLMVSCSEGAGRGGARDVQIRSNPFESVRKPSGFRPSRGAAPELSRAAPELPRAMAAESLRRRQRSKIPPAWPRQVPSTGGCTGDLFAALKARGAPRLGHAPIWLWGNVGLQALRRTGEIEDASGLTCHLSDSNALLF